MAARKSRPAGKGLAASARGAWSRQGPFARILIAILIFLLVFPPLWVGVYRFVPPPITPLMVIRLTQGKGTDYRWRPLSQISPALVQAAVAGEDARFCQHHGFDYAAMKAAMRANRRHPGKVRGGSTISQQTAKNAFLWPGRNVVRKAIEAGFTVLIEHLWGKRRIMEVYLNIVEMGPGVYGAEAAAEHYFHVHANQLTGLEASRLAAIFPDPLKWRAVDPGRYVQRRSRRIGGAMNFIRADGLIACVGHLSGAPAGPVILNAAPPAAARAFVQQQAKEQAKEEDSTAPAPADSLAASDASADVLTEPAPAAPTSDAPAAVAPPDQPND
jgi:monofunctional biosynthetic peptidoglycan transglycosylase